MADVKDQAKAKIEEGTSWAKKAVDTVADKAGDVSNSLGDQATQAVGKAQEAYQQIAVQGELTVAVSLFGSCGKEYCVMNGSMRSRCSVPTVRIQFSISAHEETAGSGQYPAM